MLFVKRKKSLVWNYQIAYITTSPLRVECGNPKRTGCLQMLSKVKKNVF